MYGEFFNIDESVFSIAPNPKYLYLSKQHEEALAHLVYGVTRQGGFVCLTGDIGTGKTTVCRCVFEQLPKHTNIAFVINPKFSPMELLASICDELKIDYPAFQPSIKEYVKNIHEYLIQMHAIGCSTVLVIDEAQNLSVEALEHVRALTNLETNEEKLLQIILIGQPELKTLLAKPELEQVNQRITARFHIGPLGLNETNRYIHHRLLVAGAKHKIFTAKNIKQIFRLTKGVPRRINILCDRVLLGAYTLGKNAITTDIIQNSAEEVFGIKPSYISKWPKAVAASIVALLVSGVAVFAYQNMEFEPRETQDVAMIKEDNPGPPYVADRQSKKVEVVTNSKEVALAKSETIEVTKADVAPNNLAEPEQEATVNGNELATVENEQENESEIKDSVVSDRLSSTQLEFTSYGKAYQRLFRLWGVGYFSTDIAPCDYAIKNHLHCYQAWGGIEKIIRLNRPVLLKSKSDQFGPAYILVVSIEDDHAIVNQNGEYQVAPIAEIKANWSGEFEMLWRPLRAGVSHIKPGEQGEAIAFLDQKLAELQGRESSITHPFVYSGELVKQVKKFQVAHNLPADGVVGPITQMQFNNKTLDTPYLTK